MSETNPSNAPDDAPVFLSLGMFVLHELHFQDPPEKRHNRPGGAGFYATLGARLFKPGAKSKGVGYMLLAGNDFPESVLDTLRSWNLNLHVHSIPHQLSTRGWMRFGDPDGAYFYGRKTFQLTTEPLQPSVTHLEGTNLVDTASIHIQATPEDLLDQVTTILELREKRGLRRPLIVWEPSPEICNVEHLENHVTASLCVDVFCPSYRQLGYLLHGFDAPLETFDYQNYFHSHVEDLARQFLDKGPKPYHQRILVIRCGAEGVAIVPDDSATLWVPSYHPPGHYSANYDPTGAGSTFLGAFAACLGETGDLMEAALRGTVAASVAVEAFSPAHTPLRHVTPKGEELWDGRDDLEKCLKIFKQRLVRGGMDISPSYMSGRQRFDSSEPEEENKPEKKSDAGKWSDSSEESSANDEGDSSEDKNQTFREWLAARSHDLDSILAQQQQEQEQQEQLE